MVQIINSAESFILITAVTFQLISMKECLYSQLLLQFRFPPPTLAHQCHCTNLVFLMVFKVLTAVLLKVEIFWKL